MKRTLLFGLMAVLVAASALAQEKPKIIRFSPDGGSGQWEVRENAKTYYYYRSKADVQVAAGVWASDGYSGQVRKATFTEFIYILEGSVVFEDKNGRETIFKAGDAVVIPRGTEFAWKRTSNFKEYWVIFDREAEGVPAPQGQPMFFRLEMDGPSGTGLVANKDGRSKQHTYFKGPDGSSVGVWDTQPYTAPGFHETKYAELMLFLKGTATLTTPDGQVEHFKAGDVALVPKGIEYKWSSDTARKYWVVFDTDSTARPTAEP